MCGRCLPFIELVHCNQPRELFRNVVKWHSRFPWTLSLILSLYRGFSKLYAFLLLCQILKIRAWRKIRKQVLATLSRICIRSRPGFITDELNHFNSPPPQSNLFPSLPSRAANIHFLSLLNHCGALLTIPVAETTSSSRDSPSRILLRPFFCQLWRSKMAIFIVKSSDIVTFA